MSANTSSVFKEFRKDGWPLCPKCGEDELTSSLVDIRDGHPNLEEYLTGPLICLTCGFSKSDAEKTII